MPLPTPNLDNRRFADIVDEARSLIPRYTGEWTDYNDSDPGMTLIHLFAWMTEMTLYRLNRVPDLAYVKFLELIGITLNPAEPARAELTFTPVRPAAQMIIPVPKGTRVAAPGSEGQPPPVFETDETLWALGATLASVLSYDGYGFTQVTAANEAGDRGYRPFGPRAAAESAILFGFDFPGPFVRVQINLMVYVTDDSGQSDVQCGLDLTRLPPPATIAWEGWNGTTWTKLPLDRDETRAFTRSGHIYVRVPADDTLAKIKLPDTDNPYYWIRARVVHSGYDRPPMLDAVLINTVAATQAETVENEVLGGSTGMPDQSLQLYFSPVIADTLVLEIDEGSGFQEWKQVEDFDGSEPDDQVYVLDRATATIGFAIEKGHIPVANPDNPGANIVARVYRHGGGSAGNVAANAITQLQGSVDGIDSVSNTQPSAGGTDEETLDQAKERAPSVIKSHDRAVTAGDFEFFAESAPGARIKRAIALPLAHPGFPDVAVPGSVTVIVIPDVADPKPNPSEAALKAVCACLDQHRLITTEVHVIGPNYSEVRIEARVIARPDADLGAVTQAAEAALTSYFSPLQGGESGTGWPLGGTIYYSLVYKTVLNVDGVDHIEELYIWLDDERQAFCQDVRIDPRSLLFSGQHDIQVTYV